jgi:two-component system, cell cycle sensor histidine kinase and response regulator CckA
VKSHGGFIHLHSTPGKGATFSTYLPANTAVAAADKIAAEDTRLPRGSGELVLVVDDEEAIRIVARRMLERFGYRVLVACDGAEAVSLYARHHEEIAVVLTDMSMPIMDGLALITRLEAMNPQVRIIRSSGLMSAAESTSVVGAGVQHFIPKPYTAGAVLKTLQRVLGGHMSGERQSRTP